MALNIQIQYFRNNRDTQDDALPTTVLHGDSFGGGILHLGKISSGLDRKLEF